MKRLFLHAHRLAFDHPIAGERLRLEARVPAEMGRFIEKL